MQAEITELQAENKELNRDIDVLYSNQQVVRVDHERLSTADGN